MTFLMLSLTNFKGVPRKILFVIKCKKKMSLIEKDNQEVIKADVDTWQKLNSMIWQ